LVQDVAGDLALGQPCVLVAENYILTALFADPSRLFGLFVGLLLYYFVHCLSYIVSTSIKGEALRIAS
jgi:hypothetical protein